MRWLWAPLTLLLFAASTLYWRRLRGARLLAVLLLTWIFVQGLLPIAVNEGRYRKPAEGLLLAQAALLLSLRRRRDSESARRDYPAHGPTVAALTAAGLLCCAGGSYLWQRQALATQFSHTGALYLSQLDADYHHQGWGRLGLDQTVDRRPISVHGHRYARGLGVHARSETRYRIPAGARYFYSRFGLDDDDGRRGRVRFKVLLDGATAYDSGTFAWGEPGEVLLPVAGADTLTLLVEPLGSRNYDHAVWAAARFVNMPPQGASVQAGERTRD